MRQAIAQGQGSSTPAVVNSGIASTSFVDGGNPGEISYDSSGNKYVWDGTSWVQTETGGAAHVADGFKQSANTTDLTVTTGGIAAALPSGVALGGGRVWLRNLDGANYIRMAWGTDATDAITNAATGRRLLAGEILPPEHSGVPALATHLGLIADTASVETEYAPGV